MDTINSPTNGTPAPPEAIKDPKGRKSPKAVRKNNQGKVNRNKLLNEQKKEEFAKALLVSPNARDAYKQVFGTTNDASATVNASKLLSTTNIKQRVRELLESRKATSLERLTERIGDHVESEKPEISLKSTELAFKLYGALDNDGQNYTEPSDININIISGTSNVNLT